MSDRQVLRLLSSALHGLLDWCAQTDARLPKMLDAARLRLDQADAMLRDRGGTGVPGLAGFGDDADNPADEPTGSPV